MDNSESQSYKNDGKIHSECESFSPSIVVEKVDGEEVFVVAITQREFLMLPMEIRRSILKRQVEGYWRDKLLL